MGSGTTALSYQINIENYLLTAMFEEARNQRFRQAAEYVDLWEMFLGIPLDEKIQRPKIVDSDYKKESQGWAEYYFRKLRHIMSQLQKRLDDIRVRYNRRSNIPSMVPN
jgi:hypothetical protein